ncbi:MAG: NAD-binding protein, partial [Proteobacteria bacterium]|nr:NAD-binding protein [Pseudomonadota bacterium]
WFGLRARSSLFAALTLSNYSEFGLIVSAIAVNQGLLSSQWLIIMAITVSLSFVVASPLSVQSEFVYRKMFAWLGRFEKEVCHPNDAPIDPGDVRAIVFGMGRIGTGAYDTLKESWGTDICGVEHAPDRVDFNRSQGRNVVLGDACDTEFWLKLKKDINLELVVLAMPNHHGNVYAARQIRNMGIKCQVVAIARFPEEVDELSQIGMCTAFNMYEQAGAGLTQAAMETLADAAGRVRT